jgi:hypothetical protein
MSVKEISVKKYVVRLSGEERERLEALVRKGKSPARRMLTCRKPVQVGATAGSSRLWTPAFRWFPDLGYVPYVDRLEAPSSYSEFLMFWIETASPQFGTTILGYPPFNCLRFSTALTPLQRVSCQRRRHARPHPPPQHRCPPGRPAYLLRR